MISPSVNENKEFLLSFICLAFIVLFIIDNIVVVVVVVIQSRVSPWAQAGLKPAAIIPSQHPKCLDYKHMPPLQACLNTGHSTIMIFPTDY